MPLWNTNKRRPSPSILPHHNRYSTTRLSTAYPRPRTTATTPQRWFIRLILLSIFVLAAGYTYLWTTSCSHCGEQLSRIPGLSKADGSIHDDIRAGSIASGRVNVMFAKPRKQILDHQYDISLNTHKEGTTVGYRDMNNRDEAPVTKQSILFGEAMAVPMPAERLAVVMGRGVSAGVGSGNVLDDGGNGTVVAESKGSANGTVVSMTMAPAMPLETGDSTSISAPTSTTITTLATLPVQTDSDFDAEPSLLCDPETKALCIGVPTSEPTAPSFFLAV
ncbi:hypothetical protein BCR34DRAFT_593676 [Clohesyomyces aquaticus]|uniref:Uncharacterized protein n=1 Tax=Clohesyomyces aquaticus TaxID=1231657 RepID=A0A1Y1YG60_9PLEO|nr:hypothetical protein BCR34DRAFT_593676 [Clohesyomyces aquaticus]